MAIAIDRALDNAYVKEDEYETEEEYIPIELNQFELLTNHNKDSFLKVTIDDKINFVGKTLANLDHVSAYFNHISTGELFSTDYGGFFQSRNFRQQLYINGNAFGKFNS